MMDFTNVLYFILEVLSIVQTCKFIRIFCGDAVKNTKIEIISYLIFSLFNIVIFKVINIPIILFGSNLIIIYLLTLNYKVKNIKRIMTVFALHFIGLAIETIGLTLTNYVFNSILQQAEPLSIFSYTVYICLFCFCVEVIHRIKKKSKEELFPNVFWLSVIIDMMVSIYFLFVLFVRKDSSQVIICSGFLFLFNFSMIYIYDNVIILMKQKEEKLILLEENKSFQKQIEVMSMHTHSNDAFRHAFKNNIILIKYLAKNNKCAEVLEQLDSFDTLIDNKEDVKTGVHIIDSILNFKLFEARYSGVEVEFKIAIPVDISYDEFDMTIIFGNLLDFIIQQTKMVEEGKLQVFLNVIFEMDLQGQGWLKIQTRHPSLSHTVVPEQEQTLKHMEKTVKQYEGAISYEKNDNMFEINIKMLLLK